MRSLQLGRIGQIALHVTDVGRSMKVFGLSSMPSAFLCCLAVLR